MRRLIVAAFVSLDGVMQAPGGPQEDESGGFAHGGWTVPYWDDAMMGETVDALFDGSRELLLGRRTYDIFAAHWPRLAGDAFADRLNGMRKHVATRSPGALEWQNSQAIGPDGAAAVRRLKGSGGADLFTQGSGDLIQSLLAAGLVDEFRLMVFPVLLGPGKRLFGEGAAGLELRLLDQKTSTTGVLVQTYAGNGPVRTGSFALD